MHVWLHASCHTHGIHRILFQDPIVLALVNVQEAIAFRFGPSGSHCGIHRGLRKHVCLMGSSGSRCGIQRGLRSSRHLGFYHGRVFTHTALYGSFGLQ